MATILKDIILRATNDRFIRRYRHSHRRGINMKISISARKPWQIPISDWLTFMKSHAKVHSNFEFDDEDIDYVFGQTEETTPLWGGRVADEMNLTRVDIYHLYDKNIGLKPTLSAKVITDKSYQETKFLLNQYHREGNALVVGTDKLAERIKNDYPKYQIEASAVFDITTKKKLEQKIKTNLYDTIVLPIGMNDDLEFLKEIKNKDQIRLFMNAECSYTCPKKVCYGSMTRINQGKVEMDDMKCSHYDLNLPRTKYDDSVDWNNFYFDKSIYDNIGFSNYKLVPAFANSQRTNIMYKNPLEVDFALG